MSVTGGSSLFWMKSDALALLSTNALGVGSVVKLTVQRMQPRSLPNGGCAFVTGLIPLHPPWSRFYLVMDSLPPRFRLLVAF
ncbi:hypothetical protein Pyn_20362 [Prunus yedoensis var. nudiflora]|uniref:Uncharacterized protein n=1 Tax=Prunus yedoensis var. nudiflora TaxID=2094558 RepID=A0A314UP46_PRUYE|nr:hypothetical protein Pyn_20362 [Prunus yedoensis var. nudiflora]